MDDAHDPTPASPHDFSVYHGMGSAHHALEYRSAVAAVAAVAGFPPCALCHADASLCTVPMSFVTTVETINDRLFAKN